LLKEIQIQNPDSPPVLVAKCYVITQQGEIFLFYKHSPWVVTQR